MSFTLKATKGANFVDREKLLDEMYETLTNPKIHMGYALYGKRRVGKSSILLTLQEKLRKNKKIVPVYISVWDLVEDTLEEFSLKLADLIVEEYRPLLGFSQKLSDLTKVPGAMVHKILSEMKIGVSLTEDIEFFIMHHQERKKSPGKLVEAAFTLAEKFAKETKTECILLIDEFPALIELKVNGSKVGEPIIKKIRSIHELQENTIICLSGSIRHTMDLTVFSSTSAFYRQLIPVKIDPLEDKHIHQIITRELGRENITDEALNMISEFTHGVPFYAQALGRELEQYTQKITEKEVNEAIAGFLKNVGDILFNSELKQLGPKERLIVVALSAKDFKSYSEIQNELREEVSNVGTFLNSLIEKAVVEKNEEGSYTLTDLVFKEWVKRGHEE